MITEAQRRALVSEKDSRFDSEGRPLNDGDEVTVQKPDEYVKYEFCSVGKRGKVISRAMGWFVLVEFSTLEGPKRVGLVNYHLQKVASA